MKNGSTLFLRLALTGMGLLAVVLYAALLPQIYKHWATEYPDIAYAKYPIIAGLVLAVITFWTAVYQAFKLLDLIDKDKSFSKLSVQALEKMKYCAVLIAGVFTTGLPVVFHIAQKEDAPGLILFFGAIFIGIPVLVAVFAGVCQRLFQNAIDIKKENDLTV